MEPASVAIIVSSIITAIISAATTVGVTVGSNEYEKSLIKKAEQNRATYSDMLSLIDQITLKAKTKSAAQQNALYNRLNTIFANNVYTSGLSETLISRVKNRLLQVKVDVENHVSRGNAYQTAADAQASAFTGMSAGERAKAKDSKGNWDLNTAAGRSGSEAEKYSNMAKEEFDKAKELGEKYV